MKFVLLLSATRTSLKLFFVKFKNKETRICSSNIYIAKKFHTFKQAEKYRIKNNLKNYESFLIKTEKEKK